VPSVTPTTVSATQSQSQPPPTPAGKGPCGGSYGLVTATLIAAAGVLVKR
jgi:hypothetical protein